jgi:hypothetical protein
MEPIRPHSWTVARHDDLEGAAASCRGSLQERVRDRPSPKTDLNGNFTLGIRKAVLKPALRDSLGLTQRRIASVMSSSGKASSLRNSMTSALQRRQAGGQGGAAGGRPKNAFADIALGSLRPD